MGATTGLDSDVWIAALPSLVASGNEYCDNYDAGVGRVFRAHTHRYWDRMAPTPVVVQTGVDAKQTITITGAPTSGTFTLTFSGQTASGLAIASTSAQIQTALAGLSSIGAGNVLVTGSAGGPWVVEFYNARGATPQPLITSTNSFLGGSSPNVSIVNTQTGSTWTTASTASYVFSYVGGIVTFLSTIASNQVVSITGGNYFNVSQLANCKEWQLDMKSTVIDTTIFQQNSWGSSQAAMSKATGKISSFVPDATFLNDLSNLMIFVLYLVKTTGIRFECYGWLSDDAVKTSMSGVVTQDVTFESDGQVFMYTQP